jgi:aspartyl-tRNA(Asn)/glutamyl-tRNA(Gln) amidotransferase subunit A
VAGPMTRSVADSALMMSVLSQPDARDSMSLPWQDIAWMNLERPPELTLKGLHIGLQLDAGYGLPVDPEVRDAVVAAAKLFEAAGAKVQPLQPFMTRAMADGMDRFWRCRSWIDLSALSEARQAKVLPYILEWARGGAGLSGEQVFVAQSQMGAIREATVAATQPFDFVLSPTSPVVSYAAEWAGPTNDPARPLEHISFTLPYNMSEQPAASINCGYTRAGLPIGLQIAGRRFDDLGVLQVSRAYEQMRPAQRAWPMPPQ